MEHEASQAICLVSTPSFSKVSIKMCCVAFNGGAIIVDATKGLTLVEMEKIKEEETRGHCQFYLLRYVPIQAKQTTSLPHNPLKKLYIKFSDTQCPFYYTHLYNS